MRKKVIVNAGLTSFVSFILGCGNTPQITKGKVIDMVYEPERVWIKAHDSIIKIGSVPVASTTYLRYVDDEDFIVMISVPSHVSGRNSTRSLYVDKETFDSVSICDFFEYNILSAKTNDEVVCQTASKEQIDQFLAGIK